MTTRHVNLTINGTDRRLAVEPDTLLLDAIRYDCGLTGTKLGCGTGDCGACTVLLDDRAVNACLVYALECEGSRVETIEGLTVGELGSAIATEFVAADAVQCGFCTPGVIVSAAALLRRSEGRDLSRGDVQEALAGNLCRCTGYLPIVEAVLRAHEATR